MVSALRNYIERNHNPLKEGCINYRNIKYSYPANVRMAYL